MFFASGNNMSSNEVFAIPFPELKSHSIFDTFNTIITCRVFFGL